MKHYLLITLGLLVLACSDDNLVEQQEFITPEKMTKFYYENSQIDTVYSANYLRLVPSNTGVETVFIYEMNSEDNDRLADDEYKESLIFQICNSLNEFTYLNEDVGTVDLNFQNRCFGSCTGDFTAINNGMIRGIQLNERTWEIAFEFTYETNRGQRTFENIINFEKAN